MSSTTARFAACGLPGCVVDLRAPPGQRVFHGDPDPMFNDAPPKSHLVFGDQLHDGCDVYTWAGSDWHPVIATALRATRTGTYQQQS